MNPLSQAIRIFQLRGINVYLHWSWFFVAVYEIQSRQTAYSSVMWNALEYIAIFLIVLTHEFGHALACRQVGGKVHQIMLWPLGGVASVSPPQRPGAMLWSIAAGPLVNVALIPVLYGLNAAGSAWQLWAAKSGPTEFFHALTVTNFALLIFNLLPVYPLDGGKILWSALWFALGRGKSLMIAAICGFVGIAGLAVLAFFVRSGIFAVLVLFIALSCWTGLKIAWAMVKLERLPRHEEFFCPVCNVRPPRGKVWRCMKCKNALDPFQDRSGCPICGLKTEALSCFECNEPSRLEDWGPKETELSTELETEMANLKSAIEPLYRAKTWLRLVAILTIAAGVLLAATIVGIVLAWIPIWAGIVLYQAASTMENPDLTHSMSRLALYFKVHALTFILPIILIGIGALSVFGIRSLLRTRQPENEAKAVEEIRTLHQAERKFHSTAGKFGTVAELEKAGAFSVVPFKRQTAYRLRIETNDESYVILATSLASDSGRYDYYSFPDGIIRYSSDPSRSPTGESAMPVP